jgi:phage terminase large subunit-like protein
MTTRVDGHETPVGSLPPSVDPYDPTTTAEQFDVGLWAAHKVPDERLLGVPAGRRALTEYDPLMFALLYLPHHLRGDETGGEITFADCHLDWCRQARAWTHPRGGPGTARDAYVAPRNVGKSTWWFLVLPLWAAAHGHTSFVAAFADSATQAETHLATFKHELDHNTMIRTDYGDLCTPARRPKGANVADNRGMLYTQSGFVFAARGIDSGTLGMKVGSRRPDLLLLDDVEPGESNYSGYQVTKRLSTIEDVIMPLNDAARLVIVGTVTMTGSIVHQLVRSVRGTEKPEPWIAEDKIRVHFYPPIITNPDGTERSCWPQRWTLDSLQAMRHTRAYAKNFANDPMGTDGGYWTPESFIHGDLDGVTRTILSIDPAVTTKTTSDPTGIAVVGWSPAERRCLVTEAEAVRLTGSDLRTHVLAILDRRPDIGLVLVEVNQGGDIWLDVLHDLPVKVQTVHQSVRKESRAAQVLAHYDRGRVVHGADLRALEEQMVGFPAAPNDDMVDAVGTAVLRFLNPPVKKNVRVQSFSTV